MAAKKRYELPGTFMTFALDAGAWRLSRASPPGADIFLRGVSPPDGNMLAGAAPRDIEIEWSGAAATLTAAFGDQRRSVSVRSAIVHQPLGRLYDSLPLANLDARSRRFWQRVFRVAKWPGGRYLLSVLSRRARSRP